MKNFKISKKLTISFALVLLLTGFAVVNAIVNLSKAGDLNENLFKGPYVVTTESMGIRRDLSNIARNINNTFLENNQNAYREVILEDFDSITTRIEKLRKASQDEKVTIDELEKWSIVLRDEYEKLYTDAQRDGFSGSIFDLDTSRFSEAFSKCEDIIIEFNINAETKGVTFNKNISETVDRSKIVSITIGVVSIVLGIAVCMYIIISLKKPIEELELAAEKMASGNFDIDIEYESEDELGILANNIYLVSKEINSIISDVVYTLGEIANGNFKVEPQVEYIGLFKSIENSILKITNDLSQTMSQINIVSEEVDITSDQVAASSHILSQGATEQASAIQELSATIMEISDKTKDTAINAKQANVLSLSAGHDVGEGNQQMKNLIKAMEEISTTSNEIKRIIKTIDDIAFQTNILALNAAVEAARAGSSGKGFAVVADEVRNLASKSAEAAKNTAILIDNSIQAVDNGSEIVNSTAISLQKITETTGKAISLIDNIAKASEEQASAISHVTLGVSQISDVVQTNSATSEESAATSEVLSNQAQSLRILIEKFKVKN